MDASTYSDAKIEQFRKIFGFTNFSNDIYSKLNEMHTVIGYILEKIKHLPEPEPEPESITNVVGETTLADE